MARGVNRSSTGRIHFGRPTSLTSPKKSLQTRGAPCIFSSTQLEHRFPVCLLHIFELPLVLLPGILRVGAKRVLHPALAVLHPSFDLGGGWS